MEKENVFFTQIIPIALTVVIFAVLSTVLFVEIVFLNRFTLTDLTTKLRWEDILIGATIYLKTAVDFGIFIGNLMRYYEGWRSRIAIELGTALGNAAGTMIVLGIWNIFRNVEWLLALMVFIASLVLFKLAEDGLEHARAGGKNIPQWFTAFVEGFERVIRILNDLFEPFLRYVIPNISMKPKAELTFVGLFVASFSIPFILGLDDFAGYVPLFNIVNVFGFAIGVLGGHMILNMALFISPKKTVDIVKNPVISLLGSIAFVGLAILGLWEVAKIILY